MSKDAEEKGPSSPVFKGMGDGDELRVRKKEMKPSRQTDAENAMYGRDVVPLFFFLSILSKWNQSNSFKEGDVWKIWLIHSVWLVLHV